MANFKPFWGVLPTSLGATAEKSQCRYSVPLLRPFRHKATKINTLIVIKENFILFKIIGTKGLGIQCPALLCSHAHFLTFPYFGHFRNAHVQT